VRHEELLREREKPEKREGPTDDAQGHPHAAVETLQRQAGNRAVAALIARQGADAPTAAGPRLTGVDLFSGLRTQDIGAQLAQQDALRRRLEPAITSFVEQHRIEINMRLPDGISMPELIDMVRRGVPDATQLDPTEIARVVQQVFGGVRIPEHRRDRAGMNEELAARVRNALPSIPRELTIVEGPGGSLRLTMSGVEGEARAGGGRVSGTVGPGGADASVRTSGGTEVTAHAGTDSASVGVRSGSVEVTGHAAYSGREFGIEGSVGPVHFAGSVSQNARGEWTNWSAQLGLPELDPSQPDMQAVSHTMQAAGEAMGDIVRRVQAGASPTDPALQEAFGRVREAMSQVSAIHAEREKSPGVSVGVRAEGHDGEVRAMATVTIRF
jgi:hypothetical protein